LAFCNLLQAQKLMMKGIVIESASQQPIEFATIMVSDNQSDKTITGATTDENGKFELQVPSSNIKIQVSFIGFATRTIEQTKVKVVDGVIDLGEISMSENSEMLEEVVVRGEKSQMEFKLDKRVFNVGKDLSSTGASALEVLN